MELGRGWRASSVLQAWRSTQEGVQKQLGLLMSISHYLLINSAGQNVFVFSWTGVLHKQAIDSAEGTIEREPVKKKKSEALCINTFEVPSNIVPAPAAVKQGSHSDSSAQCHVRLPLPGVHMMEQLQGYKY